MQSNLAKFVSRVLRGIFHSRLIDNVNLTNNLGKKTKEYKSNYKPSKEYNYTKHKVKNACYEKLEHKNKKSDKIILLLHGGGYKIPLTDLYRRTGEKLSKLLDNATVINLDYRIFPKDEYPAQLEDETEVYLELLKQGVPSSSIIMIGDSAGANLCLAAVLWLRDNNFDLPKEIVCFSTWGDMTSSGKSRIKNAYTDPFEGIAKYKSIEDNWDYLHRISVYAENLDKKSPYVSPCFADFTNFPRTTLICGTAEMDESDTDTIYNKMIKNGVDVELYKYEGMFHDFQLFPFFKESKDAYSKVVQRIKECD